MAKNKADKNRNEKSKRGFISKLLTAVISAAINKAVENLLASLLSEAQNDGPREIRGKNNTAVIWKI